MSKIYEVYSTASSNGELHSWGARRTREEAELLMEKRFTGKNKEWAKKYHERWWVEEIDTTGLFELPSKPTPRENFTAEASEAESRPGTWNTLSVDVKTSSGDVVARYERNHPRSDHDELPKGDFGFVWGCIWGDDSSWKVQYLDLSRIR